MTTIAAQGSGVFVSAPGQFGPFGSGSPMRYQVEVERDLPFPPREVAEVVDDTLSDSRSWAAAGRGRFERVDSGEVDVHILIATPETTDRLCAPLLTNGELSCRQGDRVVINARRWAFGASAFGDNLDGYRQYVINHEVGHRLGEGHLDCSGSGDPAPVMMQQTKGVGECDANSWPLRYELEDLS